MEILVPIQYLTENWHPDERPDVSLRNGTASGVVAERKEETMEMGRRGEGRKYVRQGAHRVIFRLKKEKIYTVGGSAKH